MDLSRIPKAVGCRTARKRVGRGPGSGKGKTCGRGSKGQKARSGYSWKAGFEGGQMPINRRLPKRGFRHQERFPYSTVNVDVLDRVFKPGSEVTPERVVAEGLVRPSTSGLKVLGRGEVTKPLIIRAHKVSEGARRKVEAAGGAIELIPIGDAGVPAGKAAKE